MPISPDEIEAIVKESPLYERWGEIGDMEAVKKRIIKTDNLNTGEVSYAAG